MPKFHEDLLENAKPVWDAMLGHRFLAETASGEIPRETFANWIRQDYIFVREALPFFSVLAAKAPIGLRRNFSDSLAALHQELDLFRKMAEEHDVSLEGVKASPTCHAYLQFLLATAYGRPFIEGFTVLYAAEKAYLDSWAWVKSHLQGSSPWLPFIENWAGDAFRGYVDWLAATLDELVVGEPDKVRQELQELFTLTGQYEYLFWDMAAEGEAWPAEA